MSEQTIARQPITFALMTHRAEPMADLVATWSWAEQVGYDALYMGDHLWSRVAADGTPIQPRYDVWVALTALALTTTRVAVGPYVAAMAGRPPAVLAKQAISLDHVCNGRLRLGVGAGGNPNDDAVMGTAFSPAERQGRFAEYISVLRALLEEPQTDFEGQYFRVHDAVRQPPPLQSPRPPLTIAAHVRESLAVAAQHADCWSSYGVLRSRDSSRGDVTSDDVLRWTSQRGTLLDELAQSHGRNPRDIMWSFLAGFTPDDPWQSPDAFSDFVGRYAEIGIREFVFPYPPTRPASPEMISRISEEVLPRLRALAE